VPLQFFIDESGGKGQGPFFVMAGLVGQAESWMEFSERWRTVLKEPPSIARFKMSEAANMSGCFAAWKAKDRDAKLSALIDVMAGRDLAAIGTIVDMEAFAEVIAPRNKRPLNRPYFFAFQTMIVAACYEAVACGERQRLEIIFDEHVIFGAEAQRWFPLAKKLLFDFPELMAVAPTEPMFKSDDEFMPLQAADLVAWIFRRGFSGRHAPELAPAVARLVESVRMSPCSQYVGRETMIEMQDASYSFEPPKALVMQANQIARMANKRR
jgi:Protein of unknown function (DUF3800)